MYEIGFKFQDWTIVDKLEKDNIRNWAPRKYWVLQCKCGSFRKVLNSDITNYLETGTHKNLGPCCRKCKDAKYWKEMSIIDAYKSIYTDYKAQAIRRDLSFELSKAEAFKLFTSNCYYCGSEPNNVKTIRRGPIKKYNYQGIDRLDPLKNYTIDNVVPCCSICNYAKRDMSEERFYQFIDKVYDFKAQRPDRKIVASSEAKWGLSFTKENDMV